MYQYAHPKIALASCILAFGSLCSATTTAHHEAIFGPHSTLVLSAPSHVSLQAFTRQTGTAADRTQETTLVTSAGIAPFDGVPLSVSAVLPGSHIAKLDDEQTGGGGADHHDNPVGVEDLIIGARYRFDFPSLQRQTGREGNFMMAMTAIELPTGTVDYEFGQGPVDHLAALTWNAEVGPFSALAYGYYRFHGRDEMGRKEGNILFVGGGVALTPWDDPSTERFLSLQLGWSNEVYFADEIGDDTDESTGGHALLLHPTVVWAPGNHFLVFGMTSIPVAQNYARPVLQDRWRVGAGVIYAFGHSHSPAKAEQIPATHHHDHDAHPH